MRYWKVTMSNNYCGCDEVELLKTEDEDDLSCSEDEFLQGYSFYEPDSSFIGDKEDYDTEEEYFAAYDSYIEELSVDIEELTYEEYLEECDNYSVTP